jgi:8-oxo-dGTP pyrophosphatase MutT (NUDIX family)
VITVVGLQEREAVVSFRLDHGDDPVVGLLARGWQGSVVAAEGVLGDLTLRYAVEPAPAAAARAVPLGPHGPGLSGDERQDVVPHQRVAAYAVVVSDRRLLLTKLAERTGAGGRWNLPGGGLDPGETPTEGVVREVLEETGQVVDGVRLVDVMTHHWVGRSVRGIEDYHAVRLIHVARCERPTRPVVHDVGGSTSDARWVPLAELSSVAVVASVPVALRAVGLAGDDHAGPQP